VDLPRQPASHGTLKLPGGRRLIKASQIVSVTSCEDGRALGAVRVALSSISASLSQYFSYCTILKKMNEYRYRHDSPRIWQSGSLQRRFEDKRQKPFPQHLADWAMDRLRLLVCGWRLVRVLHGLSAAAGLGPVTSHSQVLGRRGPLMILCTAWIQVLLWQSRSHRCNQEACTSVGVRVPVPAVP
jgi:hypothetical protein